MGVDFLTVGVDVYEGVVVALEGDEDESVVVGECQFDDVCLFDDELDVLLDGILFLDVFEGCSLWLFLHIFLEVISNLIILC